MMSNKIIIKSETNHKQHYRNTTKNMYRKNPWYLFSLISLLLQCTENKTNKNLNRPTYYNASQCTYSVVCNPEDVGILLCSFSFFFRLASNRRKHFIVVIVSSSIDRSNRVYNIILQSCMISRILLLFHHHHEHGKRRKDAFMFCLHMI